MIREIESMMNNRMAGFNPGPENLDEKCHLYYVAKTHVVEEGILFIPTTDSTIRFILYRKVHGAVTGGSYKKLEVTLHESDLMFFDAFLEQEFSNPACLQVKIPEFLPPSWRNVLYWFKKQFETNKEAIE